MGLMSKSKIRGGMGILEHLQMVKVPEDSVERVERADQAAHQALCVTLQGSPRMVKVPENSVERVDIADQAVTSSVARRVERVGTLDVDRVGSIPVNSISVDRMEGICVWGLGTGED